MDDMDMKERYLRNPYLKLDNKLKKQLGIDTQDVAHEVDEPEMPINKQVIVRKTNGSSKKPATDNTADDS